MNQEIGESGLNRTLKQGEALVYSEENYGGQEVWITADTPSLEPDFPAASIRIGPKTGVTVFSEENYAGLSQALTSELASFAGSRLGEQKPKSVQIWAAKPFSGYWAIEVSTGLYLSVGEAGALATSPTVSDRECFRITDTVEASPGRRTMAFSLRNSLNEKNEMPEGPQPVTLDDLQNIILIEEPEAGFRKFSLLTPADEWICYHPDENQFLKTETYEERTIFCQAIKIAEDESQVGELLMGEVALFENPAYWGKAWVFYADYADFERVVDLNEEVSSIQLGPLTCATIYREAQFRADDPLAGKQDVLANLASLEMEQVGEDQISSLRIWRIVPPEGLDVSFTCSLSQDFRKTSGKFEEYSAYRTILRLPPTVESVQVWTTDETDIEVDDRVYHVDEDHPVELKPNLISCLMITTDAVPASQDGTPRGSLSAPGLKIRTNNMLPNERIIIYPDREVHERLANMKEDDLWNAAYTDKDGVQHPVIKDRSPEKRADVASAQNMITRVMSTVKYATDPSGGIEQNISPEGLQGKAWALDFLTYRVTADALYVRKGPGKGFAPSGFLRKNDIVKVLEFNIDASWARIRRTTDGLAGWSSIKYLDKLPEIPPEQEGQKYRVTAKGLHVREGPGVEFRTLGYIQRDEVVTAIGMNEQGTWRKVVRSDGLTGWSSARYLAFVEPIAPRALERALEPEVSAALLAPLEGVSALTPNVSFHEISQEEVHALLDMAEFPEADLAQAWWSSIVKSIKSAVSVVVAEVKKVVTVIIKLVDKVVAWVVDTAGKVIAFLEEVFEKIGAVIEDIVKWLRFLFEWDDILATRDTLRESILNALTYMGQTLVQKAKEPVKNFFNNNKEKLLGELDKAIDKLGYTVENEPEATGNLSKDIINGILDTVSTAQWILSKVFSAGPGQILFASGGVGSGSDDELGDKAGDEKLERYWADTLAAALEAGIAIPEGLIDVIGALVQHLDEPLYAVAVLLNKLRNLVAGLLDIGENIVLGLLDLVTYLIEQFKKMISANIRIPFLSDLLEWLGLEGSLGFSLLDAITLILAVPITVVSKAILGEAPFKNTPALALSVDGWDITAGISSIVGGIVNAILDAVPEGKDEGLGTFGSYLEGTSWLCSLLCFIPSARDLLTDDQDSDTSKEPIDWWLVGYDVLILFLDLGSFAYGLVKKAPEIEARAIQVEPSKKEAQQMERFKRGNPGTIIIASVLGAIHAFLLISKDYDREEEEWLEPVAAIPEVLSFLRLFKNPYLIIALCISDFSAGMVGAYLSFNS
jgi:uncharacterized protein YgiM (DUF1202 family)